VNPIKMSGARAEDFRKRYRQVAQEIDGPDWGHCVSVGKRRNNICPREVGGFVDLATRKHDLRFDVGDLPSTVGQWAKLSTLMQPAPRLVCGRMWFSLAMRIFISASPEK